MVTPIRIDEIKKKLFYELQLDKVLNIPYLNTDGNKKNRRMSEELFRQ